MWHIGAPCTAALIKKDRYGHLCLHYNTHKWILRTNWTPRKRIKAGWSLSTIPLKYAVVVLKIFPVILVVALSAPAWLTWPFLPEPRQRVVLDMVKALADWTRMSR